jgi:hypothetical protein
MMPELTAVRLLSSISQLPRCRWVQPLTVTALAKTCQSFLKVRMSQIRQKRGGSILALLSKNRAWPLQSLLQKLITSEINLNKMIKSKESLQKTTPAWRITWMKMLILLWRNPDNFPGRWESRVYKKKWRGFSVYCAFSCSLFTLKNSWSILFLEESKHSKTFIIQDKTSYQSRNLTSKAVIYFTEKSASKLHWSQVSYGKVCATSSQVLFFTFSFLIPTIIYRNLLQNIASMLVWSLLAMVCSD